MKLKVTRIDRHYKYFRSRLAGSEVFQHLKKLIRAVLTISHDNAVATGRNTWLESLNGIRQVKDTVVAEDEKIHVMDFHKKLTSCIRRINDQYKQRLDERKKREEAQKNEKAGGRGGGGGGDWTAEAASGEKAFQEKNGKLRQTEKNLQKKQEV